MTDSFLSNIKKKYPYIKFEQSRSKYYQKYDVRLRLKLPDNSSRFIQRILYYTFDENFTIRVERSNLSIFTEKNEELINNIFNFLDTIDILTQKKSAADCVYEVSYDQLSLKKRDIIAPKIKEQGFNYKITIKTGGQIFSAEMKNNLLNIIEQDPDNFKVTPATEKWLRDSKRHSNWYLRYLYVKSGSTVTFLNLTCQDIIDQVYEII